MLASGIEGHEGAMADVMDRDRAVPKDVGPPRGPEFAGTIAP